MPPKSQRRKGPKGVHSRLGTAIRHLNHAKDTCGIPQAQGAFGSVSGLLSVAGDPTAYNQDYVALGLFCADACKALDRGLSGRQLDELSQSVLGAIEQLTTTVTEIQKNAAGQGKRNVVSRTFNAKNDKDAVAAWRQELTGILQIFNTELLLNNHTALLDIHRNTLQRQEDTDSGYRSIQASVPPGEYPPPPPRICLGRDDLIEKIVGFAENFEPVALIGAGGIGKTSIALTALHHNRIMERFGDNRRFIRCDEFPASSTHFLARLSKAIGAGVENPEDLTPLRPFLSSHEALIVLDNAESVLDPQGTDAREIYAIVNELCRFKTICLLITSRITTLPPHCKRPEIPTLSKEAACDIFYSIHDDIRRSDVITSLLHRLDFHPLSITLLATTALHNMWDSGELAREWDTRHAEVLRTDYNESLAATIELSLSSPTFRNLGPDARDLLGVVAFFPQGIDKDNLDWLFPTISDRQNIFNRFRVLSLTYLTDNHITMLAPIRDHLCPRDPTSSPLLCAAKNHYFTRLAVRVQPGGSGFREAQWIRSEDVNVEHLLNVFIPFEGDVGHVWAACGHFMEHLFWHKPWRTVLGSKIEALPDDHHAKSECLFHLGQLFGSVGNYAEQGRLLSHTLKIERERGNELQAAMTLGLLCTASRLQKSHEGAIQQASEALEIFERLGTTVEQMDSLNDLASAFYSNRQFDAAEEAVTRALKLAPAKGQEYLVCQSHRVLGNILRSKGKRPDALHHFEVALGLASPPNWNDELFWIHHSIAALLTDSDELEDAHAHIEQARSHAVGSTYYVGSATEMNAWIWYQQGRLEDARSEALCALEIYERLGAVADALDCKELLRELEEVAYP